MNSKNIKGVSLSTLDCLDEFDFKNGFFLFLLPLNEVPFNCVKQRDNVAHWITIVDKDRNGDFKILDSSSFFIEKNMKKKDLKNATKKLKSFNCFVCQNKLDSSFSPM
ncbi:hypothetical protein GCM10022378_15200 [Salinicoccus jeotgali]|uniref:Ubiquitin-like protease family profile domain-containing protein n=1 Tax=Salinicoccus jeotgali TaxID=381634 RepID=A0ABP7EWP6_9STAP